MTDDIVLRTINLSKRFGNRWAVDDLNLEVHRGEVFGFLGPNGAGKSTTIRMLLSLIKPSRGDVELFGRSVKRESHRSLERIGAMVESPDFYNYLSARRNLDILGKLSGGVDGSRIDEVLKIAGLSDRGGDKVKAYSHGMRQRLGIVQALLSRPELIILDEPTTGLDPQGMKDVRELIARMAREEGITIFLSSHLLHEVEQVCTSMAIIDYGKLVIQGRVRELLEDKGLYITEVKVDRPDEARKLLSAQRWVDSVHQDTDQLKVKLKTEYIPRLNILLVRQGFEVQALIPRTSLEDYFLSITGSSNGG
ncbi:ABC transporter ATP-binding protein [candidate division KSB1 bacterium]|nr:ABC transporter ATP-binding protein [candidate division KSB1 bacterium]